MTIRKKIFLLAGILLALFGIVVGVLAVIQKLDSDQITSVMSSRCRGSFRSSTSTPTATSSLSCAPFG